MYTRAIRVIVILLILQLIFPLPIMAQMVGKFTLVVGDVFVTRHAKTFKAKVGDPVEVMDKITTEKKSRARIELTDESVMTIGPVSKMEVRSFILRPNRRSGAFSLTLGKLQSQVKKFTGAGSSFEIHTPTAVAGIRGTEWISVVEGIEAAAKSSFYTLENVITVVNPAFPTQVVTVSAGQFTVVAAGLAPSVPAAFTPTMIQGVMTELGAVTTPTAAAPTTVVAAETAGTAAGVTTTAGVTAGTIAAGAAITAVAVTAVVEATGTEAITTTHHH